MTFPYQFTYHLLRYCFLPILKCFFRFEVQGLEHVTNLKHGAIIAGNHTGYLDGPMVLAAYPHIFRFLTHEEVTTWQFVGPWVKRANTILLPKAQHKTTLKFLINELKQGAHFCIFPEGKLTQNGKFNDFKDGVAFLQQKSNVPIIPFAIHGGFEAWRQGQMLPKFKKITLTFGQALPDKKDRSELTQVLQEAIQQLKAHMEAVEALEENPEHHALPYTGSIRERMVKTLAIDHNLHSAIHFI